MELDGAQYLGFRLPFTIGQLCWIEAILVGGAEVYRNSVIDPETRIYPGARWQFQGCDLTVDRPFSVRSQLSQPYSLLVML